MIYEKETKNGQSVVIGKYTGGKKWVVINSVDQEVLLDAKPTAKEFVYYKISGVPEQALEERYVIAYRNKNGWLTRCEHSLANKEHAKSAAHVLACVYDEVFILDTNYKVPQYKITEEDDPENYSRDNATHPEENP